MTVKSSTKTSGIFIEEIDPYSEEIEEINFKGDHGGTVKFHIPVFLNHDAQDIVSTLARGIDGLEDAVVLSEKQRIVLVAKPPRHSEEALKKLYCSFRSALQEWLDSLDEFERERYTNRLDFRDYMGVDSKTGIFHGQEDDLHF